MLIATEPLRMARATRFARPMFELAVVCHRDRLSFVVEPYQHGDRTEDLLANDPVTAFSFVGGRIPKHSRREPLAKVGRAAAEESPGAFGRADLAIRANLLELLGGRDRSDLRLRIFRIAHAQQLRLLRESLDETIVHSGLQENSRARLAALAGVVEDAVQRTGYGRVDIGVVKNDGRRLPAKF